MAVLVEGFTIVLGVEAVVARYPGSWDGLWREPPNGSGRHDDDLVAFSFGSRPEFRAWGERLERAGFADAGTILGATELSPQRIRTPEEIAALQARIAGTVELALICRRQPCRPPWLSFQDGRCPGTEVVVGGAWLAGSAPVPLATPVGWTVEEAVPLLDEPESGDELLPTGHEFQREFRLHLQGVDRGERGRGARRVRHCRTRKRGQVTNLFPLPPAPEPRAPRHDGLLPCLSCRFGPGYSGTSKGRNMPASAWVRKCEPAFADSLIGISQWST